MAQAYKYMGYQTLLYPRYENLDKNETLIAEPGNEYHMRACDEGLPVPPPDGWWEIVQAQKPPAKAAKIEPTTEKKGE